VSKKIVAITFLSCILWFQHFNHVFAREVGIALTPTLIDIHPTSNGVAEKSFTIQNTGKDQIDITIAKKAFQADPDGNIIYPTEKKVDEAVKKFIKEDIQVLENGIVVDTITLAPGQKQVLDLKINVNSIESTSDYTFSLFFISKNSQNDFSTEEESSIQSQLSLSIGSVMHVLIQGKKTNNVNPLTVLSFQTKAFLQNGPVPFSAEIKNTSSNYINIYGNITITNIFNQQVGLVRIPHQIVLSGGKRQLDSMARLEWDQRFLLGPYKARLFVLSENGRESFAEAKFFAFPLKSTLLVLAGLFIASFLINQVRQRLK
jgi:hypothetical protein